MDTEDAPTNDVAVPAATEKPRRRYVKHGLTRLKAAVRVLGGRVIDRRTTLGKALNAWRSDLISDLGGQEALSTQRAALVDLAVRTKLMLDSIDTWLLTRPSLVDKKKRALHAVVKERLALASHLKDLLTTLGLERKAKDAPSLSAYLRQRRADGPPTMGTRATVDVIAAPEPTSAESAPKAA